MLLGMSKSGQARRAFVRTHHDVHLHRDDRRHHVTNDHHAHTVRQCRADARRFLRRRFYPGPTRAEDHERHQKQPSQIHKCPITLLAGPRLTRQIRTDSRTRSLNSSKSILKSDTRSTPPCYHPSAYWIRGTADASCRSTKRVKRLSTCRNFAACLAPTAFLNFG